jgi:hypothetical protein
VEPSATNGHRNVLHPPPRPAPLAELLRRLADVAEALGTAGAADPLDLSVSHGGVCLTLRAWRAGTPAPAGDAPASAPAPADALPDFLRRTYLSEVEREAVKALAGQPLSARAVVRRVRQGETRVKIGLANLVDRGILRPGPDGYEITSPVVLRVLAGLKAEGGAC